MAVFVTDGDQRSTLAVVRALGGAGIPVTVGHHQTACLAGSSRFCAGTRVYPSPSEQPEEFLNWLRTELQGGRYRVLFPMTDVTLQLIAERRDELASLVRLPIPSAEQVRKSRDKACMLEAARNLGMDCPRTYPAGESSLEEIQNRAPYPLVLKSRFSRLLRDGRWQSGGLEYARTPEELRSQHAALQARDPGLLIQERIEGEGRGIFLLLWNQELKAAFGHRRLREKPPWGGVSVYRESTPVDRPLLERSLALLRSLEWQGVAMVEFKLDHRDQRFKFMEVNGRFWGSLQLAQDAGLNFPLMLYRLACGEDVPACFDYQVGVRSRWLLGDLDHLLLRLKGSSPLNGVTREPVSRLRACLDFLQPAEPNLHYEVLRREDPGPGFFEFRAYLRDLLRRSGAKQGGGDR